MFNGNGHRSLPVKGNPSGQHFKHRNAQRIDIAFFIAVAAPGLLGGSIMYGTHNIGGNGIAGSCFCNTEIRYLHLSFFGYNYVLGFDIPVYNMIVMRCFNAHGNLDSDANRFFYGKSCLSFNIFFQGNAFHQLHDNEVDIVFFPYIVNIDDIRMHQSRRRLRFYPELGNKIRIFRKFLFQHFHRHITV